MIVQLTRGYTMECNPETYFRFIMTVGTSLCVDAKGYAVYHQGGKSYKYHRWVMNCLDNDLQVSHIDANKLNNWETNLEIVTQIENLCNLNDSLLSNNKSGYRGIHWDQSRQKWAAEIKRGKVKYRLGRFDTLEQAIQARAKAEIKYGFVPKVASVLG